MYPKVMRAVWGTMPVGLSVTDRQDSEKKEGRKEGREGGRKEGRVGLSQKDGSIRREGVYHYTSGLQSFSIASQVPHTANCIMPAHRDM